MARIPDSFIEEVVTRNDIVSVIGSYIELKRSSSNMVARCPFHSEKTPSFTVFPNTQSFYCFGCHAAGDVITFIKKIENLTYVEAVKFLCERAGLTFPETEGDREAEEQRKRIYSVNRAAARYFHSVLISDRGRPAREYLKKRKLSAETIKHFGLGYAPEGWDNLLKHLKGQGFYESDIVSAGLAKFKAAGPAQDGPEKFIQKKSCFDFFRNRLIFPIIDLRGNVIGFGGRVLDNSMPKYLNSPDTPVYQKKQNLFALNFAKNKSTDRLILAEGYMDVISMHQAGFTEAVATLGTAITPEQARLMSRYAKKIIIAYDSDTAGQNAAKKASSYLSDTGVSINILKVREGKDPDEYIREKGAEAFDLELVRAKNKIEFELDKIRSKYDISLPDQKIRYIRESAALIASECRGVTREVYAGHLARETEVSTEKILAEIESTGRSQTKRQQRAEFKEAGELLRPRNSVGKSPDELKIIKAEEGIIAILRRNPDLIVKYSERLSENIFITPKNKELFLSVRNALENGEELAHPVPGGFLTEEQTELLEAVTMRSSLAFMLIEDELRELISILEKESSMPQADELSSMSDDEFKKLIKKQ